MPRIRQNIVTREWTVIAPERAKRPQEFDRRAFSSHLPHQEACVFCVGEEAWHNRVRDVEHRHFFIVPNKYPAFMGEDTLEEAGHNFYIDNASLGAHEVFVMKDPKETLNKLSPLKLAELLDLMRDRMIFYEKDSGIRSFIPIYNHGKEAGASLAHPHAQFLASNLVAPRLVTEFFGTNQYYIRRGSCVFCDMIKFEIKDNTRLIYKNRGAIAIAAFAPRFPFECWIVPTGHSASFSASTKKSVDYVAEAMHFVLTSLDKKLHNPPLNWFVHTSRTIDHQLDDYYHWHIEITPRLSTYAGYELGSDTTIETMLPEVAADFLKR